MDVTPEFREEEIYKKSENLEEFYTVRMADILVTDRVMSHYWGRFIKTSNMASVPTAGL